MKALQKDGSVVKTSMQVGKTTIQVLEKSDKTAIIKEIKVLRTYWKNKGKGKRVKKKITKVNIIDCLDLKNAQVKLMNRLKENMLFYD